MDQVQRFLKKLLLGVGSARSTRLLGYVERAEWSLLQKETMSNPSIYQNATAYLKDAIVVDIFRKCLLPGDAGDRRQAAVATFWACEAQNAATNARLARFVDNAGPFDQSDEAVVRFITSWRKEVGRVLGRLPCVLDPIFTGGSTLSDSGRLTTIPDKMSSQLTLYAGSEDIWRHATDGTVIPFRPAHVVRGNRFTTVPKDSTKDRGICIEASGNIALQCAVGKILKSRYRSAYGVDLRHAQDLHRSLAQSASLSGSHATIDLSNASDTLSRVLVKLIVPREWFELLDSLRASHTSIDGSWVRLEKFSSMGNGFTFELETIVFRSLLATLGITDCYAFGDDIICPSDRARDVISALGFFGFTPNPRKTFCEGPFRESCGGDFFLGTPVRAHFLKKLPDGPQDWVALANGLRRVDPSLRWVRAAWRFCVDQLPTQWRNFGPPSLGDLVIHDPSSVPVNRRPKVDCCNRKVTADYSIPMFRVMRPVSRSYSLTDYWKPDVALASAIIGTGPRLTPRDSVTGYKLDWVPA